VRNGFCLIILLALFFVPGFARTAVAQMPAQRPDINTSMAGEDDARARITHDMEKKAAKERVAALKSDTDKLLKLSIELKSYVDKSNENVLSVDVVKKAEEIEKLAKSVKDKMKGPN
jgi:TolA-binding protein